MVFQQRSNFVFNSHQIPRGSRSSRGKRSSRKNACDDQMYAFELLATVAGRLLLEKENSPSIVKEFVKTEQPDEDKKPSKVQPFDQGSCDEGTLTCKESSFHAWSVTSGRIGSAKESKLDNSAEFRELKVEYGIGSKLQLKNQKGGNGSGMDEDCRADFDARPPSLISSDSSIELPLYRNHIPHHSLPMFQDDIEFLDRYYEENSSGCTQPSSITTKTFSSQYIGDRRIKKVSASKFWKVGPTLLKDGEFNGSEAEVKSMFRSRKMCCTRQRTQRSSFKRRKLFFRSSESPGTTSNPSSLELGIKGEGSVTDAKLHGANGTWSLLTDQKLPCESDECKVKLRIMSFKVPEVFIEIPETATVGSLKRRVLETVSAMLENGLRVDVIFQGKKVRDDGQTLLQAGISLGDKLDNLDFSLEPNPSQAPQELSCPGDSEFFQPPDSPEPLARIPALPISDSNLVIASPDYSPRPPVTPPLGKDRCWSRELLDFTLPTNAAKTSKALVVVPSAGEEPLAVVPLHRKSKRSELVQRRIRRPFSVAEVEALVQAVEDLGTGRWRDVKIRAFENAKHRTYVDLKDKWKTLVHTARISPQQRRGEPVPQDLLDRVLAAHAHWSHQ